MAPLLTRVGQAFGFGAPSVSDPGLPGTASGGAKVTPGNGYNYHVFTKDTPAPELSFVVTGNTIPSCVILLIGGGGAGGGGWFQGGTWGGAGGGGGCVAYNPTIDISVGTYPIVVGEGAAAGAGGRTTGNPEPAPERGHWPGAAGGTSFWNGPTGVGAGGGTPGGASGQQPGFPSNRKTASNDSTLGASTGGAGSKSPSPELGISAAGDVGTHPGVTGWTFYGNAGAPASPTGDSNACSSGGGGAGGAGHITPNNNVGGKGGAGQPLPAFSAPLIAPAPTIDNPAAFILAVGPSGYYGGGGGGAAQNQGSTRGYGGNQPTSVNTGGGGCGGGSSSVGNDEKWNENQMGPNSTEIIGFVPGTGGGAGGQSGNGGYQQGPAGADGICVVRYPV